MPLVFSPRASDLPFICSTCSYPQHSRELYTRKSNWSEEKNRERMGKVQKIWQRNGRWQTGYRQHQAETTPTQRLILDRNHLNRKLGNARCTTCLKKMRIKYKPLTGFFRLVHASSSYIPLEQAAIIVLRVNLTTSAVWPSAISMTWLQGCLHSTPSMYLLKTRPFGTNNPSLTAPLSIDIEVERGFWYRCW